MHPCALFKSIFSNRTVSGEIITLNASLDRYPLIEQSLSSKDFNNAVIKKVQKPIVGTVDTREHLHDNTC